MWYVSNEPAYRGSASPITFILIVIITLYGHEGLNQYDAFMLLAVIYKNEYLKIMHACCQLCFSGKISSEESCTSFFI